MRTPLLLATGMVLVATAAASCDDTTTGQLADDTGPPILQHVLIQDGVFAGGRRMATDLLEKEAGRACSTREPCPSGEAYQSMACHFPDKTKDVGICPRVLRPQETPAPSTTNRLGGTWIRLVFSKVMANDTDQPVYDPVAQKITQYTLRDDLAKSIGLYDGDRELPTTKYYDPAGSPNDTSDLFFTPYGPAIVMKPKAQLVPLKKYSIRLNPALLKDRTGQTLAATDRLGAAVLSVYEFTVEDFYMIDPENGGGNVGFDQLKREPGGQKIKPEQAVVLFANWPFDPKTVSAVVRDSKGNVFPAEATGDLGTRPIICRESISSERINVLPVGGRMATWPVGNYTLDLMAVAQDLPGVNAKADNLGTREFKGVPFEVKVAEPDEKYDSEKDPFAIRNLLSPSECPTPPDGGI